MLPIAKFTKKHIYGEGIIGRIIDDVLTFHEFWTNWRGYSAVYIFNCFFFVVCVQVKHQLVEVQKEIHPF